MSYWLSGRARQAATLGRRLVFVALVLASLMLGPLGSFTLPVSATDQTYVVEPGDTLNRIAEEFEVSVQALLEANNLTDANDLRPGQVLHIPPPGAGPRITVLPNQSLGRIAEDYGTSVTDLMTLNGLENGDLIQPGQTIYLPLGSGRSTGRTSSRGATPPAPTPEPRPASTRVFKVTMYCLQGRMANGEWVHSGAAAADQSTLPFGARVRVDGLGTYTIKDRFAYNAGTDRLDIWEPSCARAIQWGVRYVNVSILN